MLSLLILCITAQAERMRKEPWGTTLSRCLPGLFAHSLRPRCALIHGGELIEVDELLGVLIKPGF